MFEVFCSTNVVLVSVTSAVGEVNAGSVVEFFSSTSMVLGSPSADAEVNKGSKSSVGKWLVVIKGISFGLVSLFERALIIVTITATYIITIPVIVTIIMVAVVVVFTEVIVQMLIVVTAVFEVVEAFVTKILVFVVGVVVVLIVVVVAVFIAGVVVSGFVVVVVMVVVDDVVSVVVVFVIIVVADVHTVDDIDPEESPRNISS